MGISIVLNTGSYDDLSYLNQYELDFACTSASGNIHTLAKEKLNMSKFTNTLIASVLAVAVAGPAAAEVAENGYFAGTNTKAQVKPSSCKNVTIEVPQSELFFEDNFGSRESGFWDLDLSVAIGEEESIGGRYIERKVGKDLTGSLNVEDLGRCQTDGAGVRTCDGIAAVIVSVVESSDCGGTMSDTQTDALTVTKGNVKLSNKGTRAKVDFKIEGEFTNDKGKAKKVQATIKGSKMDFVADSAS